MATRYRYGYKPYKGQNTTIETDTTQGGQRGPVTPAGSLIVIPERYELPIGFQPITRKQAYKHFPADHIKDVIHMTEYNYPTSKLMLKEKRPPRRDFRAKRF